MVDKSFLFVVPPVLLALLLMITLVLLECILRPLRMVFWWAVNHPKGAWSVFAALAAFIIALLTNLLKV